MIKENKMRKFFEKISKERELTQQRQAAKDIKKKGGFKLWGGRQLYDSLKLSGYKNEGQVLCDILDNAIQAGATTINIVTREENNTVLGYAVVDDGTGMDPDWVSGCLGFGNTSRSTKEDRDGLGRFGMGLSNGGIAFTDILKVYSRTDKSSWYMSYIDLKEGSPTEYTDEYIESLNNKPPVAQVEDPPTWVTNYSSLPKGSGTVILMDCVNPGRARWKKLDTFLDNVTHTISTTYYKLADDINIFLNGEEIWMCDPLFITPGLKGFDTDEDRAIPMESAQLDVRNEETDELLGTIRARYSVLPPTFGYKDKDAKRLNKKSANGRFRVMKEHTGVLIVRNGRHLFTIKKIPGQSFVDFGNNDYNIGVELEFTGSLDELFGVPTQKNNVSLNQNAWDLLFHKGFQFESGVQSCRSLRMELFSLHDKQSSDKVKILNKDGHSILIRPSEKVAGQGDDRKQPSEDTTQRLKEKGQKSWETEINARVKRTGKTVKDVEDLLRGEVIGKEYSIEEKNLLGADFFHFEPFGGIIKVIVNKDHRFYKCLFGSPGIDGVQREALACLLLSFVKALSVIHTSKKDQGQALIHSQIAVNLLREWSEGFESQLKKLEEILPNEEKPEDEPIPENIPTEKGNSVVSPIRF